MLRSSRARAATLLVAAFGALAPSAARPASTASAPRVRVGFWAAEEIRSGDAYWGPRDLSAYTPQVWQALAAARTPLYINLRYRRDFGAVPAGKPHFNDGLRLVREANRRGVPVWAWLVVPYADGYWSWEGNAAVTRRALAEYLTWQRAHRLRVEGVAIDSEPSIQETAELYGAFSSDPTKLREFLEKTIDPQKQCAAVGEYARLIADAHRARVPVVLAAYPPVLDDLRDGMLALQDALDVATAPPLGWDAWFFMAYRSTYAGLFRTDPTTGMVTSYLRSAREAFGRRGQITLGVPGLAPYDTLEPIVHDVRALATMDAGTVPIYSLETLVKHFGAAGLRAVLAAASQPFTGQEATIATAPTAQGEAVRAALTALDGAAVAATPIVTRDHPAGPQLPARYPDCAPMLP